jgi:hypothetical protein
MFIHLKENQVQGRVSSLKVEKDKSFTALGNIPHAYNFSVEISEAKKMIKALEELIEYKQNPDNFYQIINKELNEFFIDGIKYFIFYDINGDNEKENANNPFANTQNLPYYLIKSGFIEKAKEFFLTNKPAIEEKYNNKDIDALVDLNVKFFSEVLSEYLP